MTPPEMPLKPDSGELGALPAVSLCVLKKRADFLKAARARRVAMPGFVLQARRNDTDTMRIGFTCSKKVGNAVARNRAKRRLREIARETLPAQGTPGFDYVLIGRRLETAARPYHILRADLEEALRKVHASRPRK